MSLKFKRHYHLILLLVVILTFLTFAMGDQRIVAYTARAQDQQTETVSGALLDGTDDAVYGSQEQVNQDADLYRAALDVPWQH